MGEIATITFDMDELDVIAEGYGIWAKKKTEKAICSNHNYLSKYYEKGK
jgi:hypothetical protein